MIYFIYRYRYSLEIISTLTSGVQQSNRQKKKGKRVTCKLTQKRITPYLDRFTLRYSNNLNSIMQAKSQASKCSR